MMPHAPAAKPTLATNRPTVLFVDDEERILRSLRLLFGGEFNIRVTTSGYEALEILKRERIHVLVSDQRMPAMQGVELLRQARDISPNTMRLLLTGYSDMEATIGSINEGEIFRYVSKPWNQDDMRATIRQAAEIAICLPETEGAVLPAGAENSDVILIIDEDPAIAIGIKAMINEQMPGKRVEWASTLEMATAVLERGKVALVISEIRLQGQDITPFISALKEHNPFLITIVQTSLQDISHLIRLINQGQVFRFLPKPVRRTMLHRGMVSGLDRHHAMKRTPQLARRHVVEAAPKRDDSPLIRRISQFFSAVSRPQTRGH